MSNHDRAKRNFVPSSLELEHRAVPASMGPHVPGSVAGGPASYPGGGTTSGGGYPGDDHISGGGPIASVLVGGTGGTGGGGGSSSTTFATSATWNVAISTIGTSATTGGGGSTGGGGTAATGPTLGSGTIYYTASSVANGTASGGSVPAAAQGGGTVGGGAVPQAQIAQGAAPQAANEVTADDIAAAKAEYDKQLASWKQDYTIYQNNLIIWQNDRNHLAILINGFRDDARAFDAKYHPETFKLTGTNEFNAATGKDEPKIGVEMNLGKALQTLTPAQARAATADFDALKTRINNLEGKALKLVAREEPITKEGVGLNKRYNALEKLRDKILRMEGEVQEEAFFNGDPVPTFDNSDLAEAQDVGVFPDVQTPFDDFTDTYMTYYT